MFVLWYGLPWKDLYLRLGVYYKCSVCHLGILPAPNPVLVLLLPLSIDIDLASNFTALEPGIRGLFLQLLVIFGNEFAKNIKQSQKTKMLYLSAVCDGPNFPSGTERTAQLSSCSPHPTQPNSTQPSLSLSLHKRVKGSVEPRPSYTSFCPEYNSEGFNTIYILTLSS